MFKVPFFKGNQYNDYMMNKANGTSGIPYSAIDTSDWVNFKYILAIMSDEFIKKHQNLKVYDVRGYVGEHANDLASKSAFSLGGDRFESYKNTLLATKIGIPTLWACKYFYWEIGEGSHDGVDIMLPKGTPLPSFAVGEVIKAKRGNGYGNHVVVKTKIDGEEIYLCYEHMDSISVKAGDKVNAGDTVGTAGTTGNSTQYHVHFQIDKASAPYHPYYAGGNPENTKKYTLEPLAVLRKLLDVGSITSNSSVEDVEDNPEDKDEIIDEVVSNLEKEVDNKENPFSDMPDDEEYANAIYNLNKMGFVKGYQGKVEPMENINRYEFSLIIHRLLDQLDVYDDLKVKNEQNKTYSDVYYSDIEFKDALEMMYKYNIMKGKGDLFMPDEDVTGDQLIAVLGRVFYDLEDGNGEEWYKPYVDKFSKEKIISKDWDYIQKPVPRQEVFKLIYDMLVKKDLI